MAAQIRKCMQRMIYGHTNIKTFEKIANKLEV